MQFALIIAVVATFLLADAGSGEPVDGIAWRLPLLILGASVAPLLAWLGAATIARGVRRDGYGATHWRRRFSRLRQVLLTLWLGLSLGAIYAGDWSQIVRVNWGLGHWFLVDELLLLTPVVIPLVLIWAAYYDVERAIQFSAAPFADEPLSFPRRGRYLALQARHYFGLSLAPVLAVIAVHDACSLFAPDFESDAYMWLVYTPALVLVLVLFPWFLRFVWHTSPLPDGPLRQELQALASGTSLRVREIYVWQTDGQMLNAAVAGFFPRWRYVFLTDGLLRHLSPPEIAAAFAHEIGHVRFRHLWLRLVVLVAPVVPYLCLYTHAPAALASASEYLAQLGWAPAWQGPLLLPLLCTVYAFVSLGWYSRMLEHEADLWAAGLAAGSARTEGQLEHFTSALDRLALLSGTNRQKKTWLHPSIEGRIAFLRRAAATPRYGRRFQAFLRPLPALWLVSAALLGGLILLWP